MTRQMPRHLGKTNLFDGREDGDVLDLTIGAPGPSTLERVPELFTLAHSRLQSSSQERSQIYQYGPSWGYEPFLYHLAQYLTESYGSSVNPESLFLTAGATNGLWLVSSVFLPVGKGVVFVEDPTYFLALNIIQNTLGHKVVRVPMAPDGTGVDVEALEAAVEAEFEKREEKKNEEPKFWAMFYTIPSFHNPTGSCLTDSKSRKVVQIARNFDLLVLCDDVYNLLHFETAPPRRLFDYDSQNDSDYQGHVVSNGTFSKILGPGTRVGWLEIAPRMFHPLEQCGIIQSGGSLNNVMAAEVSAILDLQLLTKHVAYLRVEYEARVKAMFEVFDSTLPVGFAAVRPKGGYFIWVSGPEGFNSDQFLQFCLNKKKKLRILPSSRCSSQTNSFRISFAFYGLERLIKAAKELCRALSKFNSE